MAFYRCHNLKTFHSIKYNYKWIKSVISIVYFCSYPRQCRSSVLSWPRLLSPWNRAFLGRVCGVLETYESASPKNSSPHPDYSYSASQGTRPYVHQDCPCFRRSSAPGCAYPGTVGVLEVEVGLTHTRTQQQ